MKPLIIAVTALVTMLILAYGAYRVHRHFFTTAALLAPTQIPSHCISGQLADRASPHPIIAFGDSITNGLGASRRCLALEPTSDNPQLHAANPHDSTYPDDLARLTDRVILNYGYGGETTTQGVHRLLRLFKVLHPRTVLIMEGTNDLLQGQPPTVAVRNLRGMVVAARRSGVDPVLLTVIPIEPPAHGPWRQLDRQLTVLARMDRVTLVNVGRGLNRADFSPDGIHPNDHGYEMISRAVARTFRPGRAVPG